MLFSLNFNYMYFFSTLFPTAASSNSEANVSRPRRLCSSLTSSTSKVKESPSWSSTQSSLATWTWDRNSIDTSSCQEVRQCIRVCRRVWSARSNSSIWREFLRGTRIDCPSSRSGSRILRDERTWSSSAAQCWPTSWKTERTSGWARQNIRKRDWLSWRSSDRNRPTKVDPILFKTLNSVVKTNNFPCEYSKALIRLWMISPTLFPAVVLRYLTS